MAGAGIVRDTRMNMKIGKLNMFFVANHYLQRCGCSGINIKCLHFNNNYKSILIMLK